MTLFDNVKVSQRQSGLLIPSTADVTSANEKIAEQYRKDAITHAVGLMKALSAKEIASFLFTKNHSIEIILEQE